MYTIDKNEFWSHGSHDLFYSSFDPLVAEGKHFIVWCEWLVWFLVACYATLHPALSVVRLVGWSHFTFFNVFFLWPYCSCPTALVSSNMAPAHPHATGVAVYPALFIALLKLFNCNFIYAEIWFLFYQDAGCHPSHLKIFFYGVIQVISRYFFIVCYILFITSLFFGDGGMP